MVGFFFGRLPGGSRLLVRVPSRIVLTVIGRGFSPFIFKSPRFLFSAVSVLWGEARCRRPSCRLHLVVMMGVLRRRRPLRHLRQAPLGGHNIERLRCWGMFRGRGLHRPQLPCSFLVFFYSPGLCAVSVGNYW